MCLLRDRGRIHHGLTLKPRPLRLTSCAKEDHEKTEGWKIKNTRNRTGRRKKSREVENVRA